MTLDPDQLRALLLPSTPLIPVCELRQAAVLVLLYPGDAGLQTVLTRRSAELPEHAGQISLPGGRVQPGDLSVEATALREAAEETGLAADGVRILGRLPQIVVQSSSHTVTPVVAWSASRPSLQANPREVAELIECPLSLVLDPAAYQLDFMLIGDIKREFYSIELNNYYVWGATARILRSLALLRPGH